MNLFTYKLVVNVFALQISGGKITVLGSYHMFSDNYIEKEENIKVLVSFEGRWREAGREMQGEMELF